VRSFADEPSDCASKLCALHFFIRVHLEEWY
jgi:hypothetical protein